MLELLFALLTHPLPLAGRVEIDKVSGETLMQCSSGFAVVMRGAEVAIPEGNRLACLGRFRFYKNIYPAFWWHDMEEEFAFRKYSPFGIVFVLESLDPALQELRASASANASKPTSLQGILQADKTGLYFKISGARVDLEPNTLLSKAKIGTNVIVSGLLHSHRNPIGPFEWKRYNAGRAAYAWQDEYFNLVGIGR